MLCKKQNYKNVKAYKVVIEKMKDTAFTRCGRKWELINWSEMMHYLKECQKRRCQKRNVRKWADKVIICIKIICIKIKSEHHRKEIAE